MIRNHCRIVPSRFDFRRGEISFFFSFSWGREITGEERRDEIFDSMTRREKRLGDGTWHRYYFRAKRKSSAASRADSAFSFVYTKIPIRNCGRRFNESRSKCSFIWYSYFARCIARTRETGYFCFIIYRDAQRAFCLLFVNWDLLKFSFEIETTNFVTFHSSLYTR